jgi:hypothetical protein
MDVLPLVARSRRGVLIRPLLILDRDKKEDAERKWQKVSGDQDPRAVLRVVWLGDDRNDFESVFCVQEFLVAFIESAAAKPNIDAIRDAVSRALEETRVAARAGELRNEQKGCRTIAKLLEAFGEEEVRTKEDLLLRLVAFYVTARDTEHGRAVSERFRDLIDALVAPDEEPAKS